MSTCGRAVANPALLLGLASSGALLLLVAVGLGLRGEGPLALGGGAQGKTPNDRPLRLYCAAGLREPTERVIADYEAAYGVKVELHTHGSGTLFGQIRTEAAQGRGPDLYLTAESWYMDDGRARGLIRDVIPIGTQRPVIVVRPGNPKGVTSLRDFIDPAKRIDFGIANEGAAIGRKTRTIAEAMGILGPLESMRKTEQETVVALAEAVKLGSLDAAVVWDMTAKLTDGVEVVQADEPAFDRGVSRISIGVIATSDRRTEALGFARYLTARDKGLAVYRDAGLDVVEGDR